MRICSSVAELRTALGAALGDAKCAIGFVPTMGALHDGHVAVIERARAECALVVVSIFVNPKQFGAAADLERYPRTPSEDARIASAAGCDVLFSPTPEEMYPSGAGFSVQPGSVAESYEGAFRPGHFEGVCLVVCKLFHLVGPDRAYFGTKDAQQLAVVRAMVRELDFPIEVVGVETVRAADGLALSSRNRRLSGQGRMDALGLHAGLQRALHEFRGGERDPVKLAKSAQSPAIDYEYCACVDPTTFGPPQSDFLIVLAATVDGVRLIDNLRLTGGDPSR
jgi:pantoate--beta-alanine ligase